MEKVKLNLKALGERHLDYGGYVEEVDGEYYLCANDGRILATDGAILERPANTMFAVCSPAGNHFYFSQEEFKLACIPVKEEQMEKEACNVAQKEPITEKEIEIGIKAIDDFLATLLDSEFDSGATCEDEWDLGIWFDCGVGIVKDTAKEIAEEIKKSLLQRVSDKEEEVER